MDIKAQVDLLMTVADIKELFAKAYLKNSTKPTVELIGTSFKADQPKIFGKINQKYINQEIEWYLTQDCNISAMKGKIPKIWKDIASIDGFVNSNYGYLFFSGSNHHQYYHVIEALKNDKYTRQAMAIYNRPSMHYDSRRSNMKDFVCTNAVSYMIRDDVLYGIVNMRSNDAVFGYKNDLPWQMYALNQVYNALKETYRKLTIGPIIWQTFSLHVYSRHYNLIEDYINSTEN